MNYEGMTINNWHVLKAKDIVPNTTRKYICKCTHCGAVSVKTIAQMKKVKTGKCRECPPNYNFTISHGVAEGSLPDGTHFFIDSEDVPSVSQHHWRMQKGYITHSNGVLKLHQFLMGFTATEDFVIDHINRNPLDCRKSNLRIVTWHQNSMNVSIGKRNRTGFLGVYFDKHMNRYVSKIGMNNKRIYLYSSHDPKECAAAYNLAAEELYGEYAGYHNPVPKASEDISASVMARIKPYMIEAEMATRDRSLFLCQEAGE